MAGKKKIKIDIPIFKKEKKEKKGGAIVVGQGGGSGGGGGILARWFGAGARPAASSLSGSAGGAAGGAARVAARVSVGAGKSAMGAAGIKLGLLPTVINFFASNVGIGVLAAALSGGTAFTLFTMGGRSLANDPQKSGAMFPFMNREAPAAETFEESDEPGSLNFFTSANQGKAYDRDAPAGGGEEIVEPDGPIEDEDAAEFAEGTGPDLAAELVEELETPKMIAAKSFGTRKLGGGVGLVGGAGMAGGVRRKFDPKKKPSGRLSKMIKPTRNLTAHRSARKISRVGGSNAMKQLRFSNRRSVKALGRGSAESQTFEAAEAFDSAPASAGGSIGGAGVNEGGAGASGSANSGAGADDGGPLGDGTRGEENVDRVGRSDDKSPYTGMLMMAQAMLLMASTIIAMMGILSKFDKTPLAAYLAGIKMALYASAIGMSAAATAIGLSILMQYGQNTQAMILTTGGALTTTLATLALVNWDNDSVGTWLAILGGVAGLATSVGSFLMPKSGGGTFGAKA